MANYTHYKGNFKTGWNQREIHEDLKLARDAMVGTICSFGTGTAADTLTPITTAPQKGTKYAMIAQSDTTIGNGHVPVEDRDWMYYDDVKASTTKKHIAYYYVDGDEINTMSYDSGIAEPASGT